MIVVDDPQEPQSPGERSPLKSPSVTTRAGLPLPQAPPPPYAATNAESSRPYFPVPSQGHLPPPVTLVLVHRRSAVRRFLRALAVAIFVLFLWGLFVDSLSLRAPIKNNKGGRKHVDRRANGMVCYLRSSCSSRVNAMSSLHRNGLYAIGTEQIPIPPLKHVRACMMISLLQPGDHCLSNIPP